MVFAAQSTTMQPVLGPNFCAAMPIHSLAAHLSKNLSRNRSRKIELSLTII